jgi:very-short-patch-repair endonuclease
MPADPDRKDYPYLTPPALWAKLKPLARQKRRDPTPAEDVLWERLRNRQLAGLKFRRQHSIDRFIVDFYCADAQIIIEVDGPVHEYTPDEDAIRQEFLESLGYRVLRFTNDDVLQNLNAVIQVIADILPNRSNP